MSALAVQTQKKTKKKTAISKIPGLGIRIDLACVEGRLPYCSQPLPEAVVRPVPETVPVP